MNLCLSKISLVITSVNVLPSFAMNEDMVNLTIEENKDMYKKFKLIRII